MKRFEGILGNPTRGQLWNRLLSLEFQARLHRLIFASWNMLKLGFADSGAMKCQVFVVPQNGGLTNGKKSNHLQPIQENHPHITRKHHHTLYTLHITLTIVFFASTPQAPCSVSASRPSKNTHKGTSPSPSVTKWPWSGQRNKSSTLVEPQKCGFIVGYQWYINGCSQWVFSMGVLNGILMGYEHYWIYHDLSINMGY